MFLLDETLLQALSTTVQKKIKNIKSTIQTRLPAPQSDDL